jgi:quercetin dioxygenase-like cupin family protein
VFVVEGELDVHLGDEHIVARLRSLLHIPAGARHELIAPDGALILIAQDSGASSA